MNEWGTRTIFAVSGLLIGAVGGVVGGRSSVTPPVVASDKPTVSQPEGALTKEAAWTLIEKEYANKPGAECLWQEVSPETNSGWGYSPHNEVESECVEELEHKGLAKRGECTAKGCTGGCCTRLLDAIAPAKYDEKAGGMLIPCGTFKLIGITSIATEGNTATVKFEREYTEDTAGLDSCRLRKPEAGKAELHRIYKRDDAGNWAQPP